MKKVFLLTIALIFLTLSSEMVCAQVPGKKEPEANKPTSTSIDAWREAIPQNEESTVVTAAKNEVPEVAESSQQIEKIVTDLELKLAESLKMNDSATLKLLLADNFVPVGNNITKAQTGKNNFIKWALKNAERKSLSIEKITVRVFGSDTAIATVIFKKDPQNAAADGFVATDVWVRTGNSWQAASHHISRTTTQQ